MISLNVVWGVCGMAIGILFATFCMVTSTIVDDWIKERKK